MMAPTRSQCKNVINHPTQATLSGIEANLSQAKGNLEQSGLLAKSKHFLAKILDGRSIRSAKAIGIGNFGDRAKSNGSLQMALFLAIREQFDSPKASCQDPVMNPTEVQFLQKVGVEVPELNDLSSRETDLEGDDVVLFFMPHCGHGLYNNLLWSNWDPQLLKNLVIVGNDFSKMVILEKHEHEVQALLKYREVADSVNFPAAGEDAFSDTSFMSFSGEFLPDLDKVKPAYDHFAPELVINKH
ncbi:hypothetical protein L596_011819 [Steinernema carpocapsae]|uniref:SRR1-like domain-containing protein n=1 Tax=Steinernema carpocapsae TaxID=34508 RepID=A0A4U5NV58_STECR|nr:hypothetical protein L596_011819 [Steinernema carpocapsae]